MEGAEAATAIDITPLDVSLVGVILLSWFSLRSLRAAGVVVSAAELLARVGAVTALFVVTPGRAGLGTGTASSPSTGARWDSTTCPAAPEPARTASGSRDSGT
ncbi:hypothetical protein ACFWHW_29045 [Streptomyces pharetrae]|uniref:hypothetical protein n=1 Tax=Streptomyces pharetrae TaxID=291370 RepID=UPI003666DA39